MHIKNKIKAKNRIMSQRQILTQLSQQWEHQSQIIKNATKISFHRQNISNLSKLLISPKINHAIGGSTECISEKLTTKKVYPTKTTYKSNNSSDISPWNNSFYCSNANKFPNNNKIFFSRDHLLYRKTHQQLVNRGYSQWKHGNDILKQEQIKKRNCKSQEHRLIQQKTKKLKSLTMYPVSKNVKQKVVILDVGKQKINRMMEKQKLLLSKIRVTNKSDGDINSETKLMSNANYFMYPTQHSHKLKHIKRPINKQIEMGSRSSDNNLASDYLIGSNKCRQNKNIIKYAVNVSSTATTKLVILED